jgi:hypothetical protein
MMRRTGPILASLLAVAAETGAPVWAQGQSPDAPAAAPSAPAPAPAPAPANDYPTAARADYVLGCMAANGNTREALMKCSCSIDAIAKQLPYQRYELAETALSMQAGGGVGGRVGLFRDPPEIKQAIEDLRRAQADANLECFE